MNAGNRFRVRPMYPWRFGEFDNVMDDALNIALDYLIRTDQAVNFREVQALAADAIADAWRAGCQESNAADQPGDQGG